MFRITSEHLIVTVINIYISAKVIQEIEVLLESSYLLHLKNKLELEGYFQTGAVFSVWGMLLIKIDK